MYDAPKAANRPVALTRGLLQRLRELGMTPE
jgi:hypothetical protein